MTLNLAKLKESSQIIVNNPPEEIQKKEIKNYRTPKHVNKTFDFTNVSNLEDNSSVVSQKKHRRVMSGSNSRSIMGENALLLRFETNPVKPFNKTELKWKESFVLRYSSNVKKSQKLFSITLTEFIKVEDKIIGNERTFELEQFDTSKIYDLEIEFRKNFKAEVEARVNIKLQYIKAYS